MKGGDEGWGCKGGEEANHNNGSTTTQAPIAATCLLCGVMQSFPICCASMPVVSPGA